jgi:hypothetical protein
MKKPIKKPPEPMALILSRAEAIARMPEQYRAPQHDSQRVRDAVAQFARANLSDPFAARRMALYLKRGLELPSDILADSNRQIQARLNRKVKADVS